MFDTQEKYEKEIGILVSNMKKLKMELRTETKLREIWMKILPWWVEISKINDTLNKLESKKGPYFEWDVFKKVHASVEDGDGKQRYGPRR